MTKRILSLIRLSIAAALASVGLGAGCASSVERSGNSNTNWLHACNGDEDCGSLRCLCGMCTRSCATGTCKDLDSRAECVTPPSATAATCGPGFGTSSVCTATCTGDGDCAKLGASLRCRGGACLGGVAQRIQEAGVDSSGGSRADVVTRDGAADGTRDGVADGTRDGAADGTGAALPDAPAGGPEASCEPPGPGRSECGPNHESCCTSPVVTGGTFLRSYDGATFSDDGNPATVGDFRLDRYEITVGRFRNFVSAAVAGWRPSQGSGKHAHLNGGHGLADSSAPGGFESGWEAPWNSHLGLTKAGWDSQLGGSPANWTPTPGGHEHRPIDSIDWYQAYAFCIWDGGFLPSEAEWNYAAAGGSEQRVYPWSEPPQASVADCNHASYKVLAGADSGVLSPFCTLSALDVGSLSPAGDGKWGQSDLAGNAYEWTLDWRANYVVPCENCAFLSDASGPVTLRVKRGGNLASGSLPPDSIATSDRSVSYPDDKVSFFGARCARIP